MELPPQTFKKIDASLIHSSNILNEAKYRNITSTWANNTNYLFGYAVKYRVVEQNLDKTLYKLYKYNVGKTIAEQGL